MNRPRCILLYSGGLDSLLAAKLLMEQSIDVTGFHCILPFYPPDLDADTLEASQIAKEIELKLIHHRLGSEYIDIVKNPPHGYGKNMNPCIDCKIHFIQKAAEYMKKTGADFIATGEVVGQRPMSQLKHMLNHIQKETDLQGRLLRPLSAKILAPTIPEAQGLINREKLLNINGRSRKKQMELAKKYGIKHYSSPAGGCMFTDPFIAMRIRDLFTHHISCEPLDLYLLTLGRHFRLSDSVKIIVSRNEKENIELEKYLLHHDYLLEPHFKGPHAALKGASTDSTLNMALKMVSRYGKPGAGVKQISIYKNGALFQKVPAPDPISDDEIHLLRI